mmetsp:Transcript_128973/g.248500  ORF Transcript_128973/g.248500 Transcript_128973/m.248500 type:complete len:468 (+) Transcript_128973:42-1445(+)
MERRSRRSPRYECHYKMLLMTCAVLSASPALGQISGQTFSQEVAQLFVQPHTPEAVKAKATAESKPIMVIIMSKTCTACSHLREGINNGKEIQDLMRSFVVAYLEDDPSDVEWKAPDQNYVPQTYFFTSAGGRLIVESPSTASGYKFYFSDASSLTVGCYKALELAASVGASTRTIITSTLRPLADPWGGTRFLDEVSTLFVQPPTVERVKEEAAKTGKPIMVIIMTTWCSACKGLRYQINTGTRIRSLMESFVVVYFDHDDGAASSWKTEADVQYVPQTYFFNSDAVRLNVESSLASRGFKYSYTDQTTLIEGMSKALALVQPQGSSPPVSDHAWASNIKEKLFDSFEPQRLQDKAAAEGKPYMVILTQDWCEACDFLINSVNQGDQVRKLLPSFVASHAYGPNGLSTWQRKGEQYVPQAYFFNSDGSPLDVPAPHAGYRYFFVSDQELAAAMTSALELKSAAPEL